MPPTNPPNPTAQSNGHARKRTAPVVPAIPLALSKPKPTKTQPKSASDAKGGAEELTPVGIPVEAVNTVQESPESLNGVEDGDMQANGSGTSQTASTRGAESAAQGNGAAPVANGVVLNGSDGQASRPSTASTPGDATATNSPELSRKPTQRFDMRQIRTELPPAFIPSAEQHTPRSNASSQSARHPIMPAHAHPSHPSGSNIVFGSRDSSSSSPAPPQSAGSAYNPPSFPSFNGAPAAQFHPSGHAHNTSDHQASRTFQPGFQQPVPQWNGRQGFAQQSHQGAPHHPPAHIPFRYPPREAFTPVDSPRANGKLSRPDSEASSTAADQSRPTQLQSTHGTEVMHESRSSFPPPQHSRHFNQQMPPPPPHHFQTADVTSQMDNAEALRSHILSHFANPNFVDCHITFSEASGGARQTFSGHRVVLSRSPTLMQLLASQTVSTSRGFEVEVPLKGPYLKLTAINDALKYLYGGALLLLDPHRPGSSAGERTLLNVEKMESAVSYIAIGSWLKLSAIAGRGVEIAGSLLHWDTMPTALAFALDGGLSQLWTVDDGSEDPFSAASSDESLSRSEVTGAPTYDPYSTALLQRIVDFMIHVFPPNFFIDAAAPQLDTCQRLPPLPRAAGHEGRSSVSDPRLSQIRFGEIPTGPSFTTTMISSILLSLPFQLLKAVLEHFVFATRLGPETAASIMRQVVTERERRRAKAQEARSAGRISSSTDAQLLQNLYWEEFVEPSMQHKAGFRLARRRKGIDTPLSSGPE